jgi:NAD(P)-dependent dehydrogenase (short-subunit alcohol dehydrogenase family)
LHIHARHHVNQPTHTTTTTTTNDHHTTPGGIEGLARSLAAELAPAVRVNAIAPSLTDTPLASVLTRSTAMKCVRFLRFVRFFYLMMG